MFHIDILFASRDRGKKKKRKGLRKTTFSFRTYGTSNQRICFIVLISCVIIITHPI